MVVKTIMHMIAATIEPTAPCLSLRDGSMTCCNTLVDVARKLWMESLKWAGWKHV